MLDTSGASDPSMLGRLLPGVWHLRATNLPMWLTGERLSPGFEYELASDDPLVLRVVASYRSPEGAEVKASGIARWKRDHFDSPGKGMRRMLSSRWSIAGASEDGTVVVIRFEKSTLSLDGLDVLVHADTEVAELRSMVAASTEQFGLSPEDFGSLSWLPRTGVQR